MKNATLRQLKVFEAVARLLSYSRAAEELFLSQPAVSIQIRKLEEHAGNALFEQFGKKIYLTPAGTELLRISRAIIQQFEAAENAMTQFRGVSGGRLNVGVISAGDYFFPRLLVEFAGRHSGVVLNFTVHNREELLARIADNLTDLAIMVRPPADLDAESQPFAPHPYVIVAAPHHPLVGRKKISMATLMREQFVVREKGSDTWKSMEEGFGEHIRRHPGRDGDSEHRDHQAGGDRRHGHQLPVGAHDQQGAEGEEPAPAPRAGLPVDAELVRRPSTQQAPASGGAGLQGLPAQRRRVPDSQIVPFDPSR